MYRAVGHTSPRVRAHWRWPRSSGMVSIRGGRASTLDGCVAMMCGCMPVRGGMIIFRLPTRRVVSLSVVHFGSAMMGGNMQSVSNWQESIRQQNIGIARPNVCSLPIQLGT